MRWLGSVAVGHWTRDQEVAGLTPTVALFGQQPWASCSHLLCLCSPSSITWYLVRAFMLKAPYCWQRHRVKWTRGYCRAVLRWFSNCTEPRYKSSALSDRWLHWKLTDSRHQRSYEWCQQNYNTIIHVMYQAKYMYRRWWTDGWFLGVYRILSMQTVAISCLKWFKVY